MTERCRRPRWLGWAAAALALVSGARAQDPPITVGAKNFTESNILAEIIAQTIEGYTDLPVERRINLGGTMICWSALRNGGIDIYPEYTGTAWEILLKEPGKIQGALHAYLYVRRRCEELFDVHWMLPFGFSNTYALAMREDIARKLGVVTISDLRPYAADLSAGFSIEFMRRDDGYPGLSKAYDLELGEVRALEHSLAYAAIRAGEIDLIDAYSTDGKLLTYDLTVLEDDRGFFPPYHAVPIIRGEALRAHPELREVLSELAFELSDEKMQRLNAKVESEGLSFATAARLFLRDSGVLEGDEPRRAPRAPRAQGFVALMVQRAGATLDLVLEHLGLTLVSVALAAAIAIPLGIGITRRPHLGRLCLGVAGVLQTIPSLALLAFMIPLLGLGVRAAIAALLLYALLPILRNTYTGIREVDPDLVDAARGIGMTGGQILRHVELPLATRTIMAGIRTATVISIGVATLAAFIGAGGLGEPIITGLYLNDTALILAGAVPAALLAVLADLALGGVERWLAPVRA